MNKKLIKTIASVTCGLGIAISVPTMISSCGCKSGETPDVGPKSISINWTGKTKIIGEVNQTLTPDGKINVMFGSEILKKEWEVSWSVKGSTSIIDKIKISPDGKMTIDAIAENDTYYFSLEAKLQSGEIISNNLEFILKIVSATPNILPSDQYDIIEDEYNNKYINKFIDSFEKDDPQWQKYDALEIPANINCVRNFNFSNDNTPSSIKKLIFNNYNESGVLSGNWYMGNYISKSGTPINEVVIPEAVKSVDQYLLASSSVEKIDFSHCDSLETLNQYALSSSGFKKVTLPGSLQESRAAFDECQNLTTVAFEKNENKEVKLENTYNGYYGCFSRCGQLSTIIFEELDELPNNYIWGDKTFDQIATVGKIISFGGKITSEELLAYFKNEGKGRGGFDFAEWTAG